MHGAAHQRAAPAASAAAAAATCLLLDLSHDEVSIVTHELCDPLRPLLAVHLSSTAKGLREAMEEQLAELKQQTQQAAALAALCGRSCAQLRDAAELNLGAFLNRPLTLAHWRTLGTLARCGSLPRLDMLAINGSDDGDEGVALLADGLRRGRLPSLRCLTLTDAQIGPQGATALAPALTKRALPSLEILNLGDNLLGGAGLTALAPALRQLPKLETLFLEGNQITDQGVASLLLVAPPTAGVLPSLRSLYLGDNPSSAQAQAGAEAQLLARA